MSRLTAQPGPTSLSNTVIRHEFASHCDVVVGLAFSLLPGASNRLAAQESRDEPPLIMAHYMPWYSADGGAGRWGWHWTMNHFDPTRVTEDAGLLPITTL
ncbi:MAG: hypothetical protein R3B96_15390 [Pirellulaceae bacterium]